VSKHVRLLSGKKDKAPKEFYDDDMEQDKEFFDIVSSMKKENNLRSMSALHVSFCSLTFCFVVAYSKIVHFILYVETC